MIDLGTSPPSNAYLSRADLELPEVSYPLRVLVCEECWLVQTEDFAKAAELFSDDYAYFSSTSSSWVEHSRKFASMVVDRLGLGRQSFIVELASNDGYLLRYFLESGIPCLGIEPTKSTADAAEAIGIPVLREFFGSELAARLATAGRTADLIVGNNVFAHVPDINDFTLGIKTLLRPGGTVTLEFPHLLNLIEKKQFDTIYHEHFSYLSLTTVSRIFQSVGLRIWDVEELETHGGSLRVYGCHEGDSRSNDTSVEGMLDRELDFGLTRLSTFQELQGHAEQVRDELIAFLTETASNGKKVVGYGAAAKGNTLLNFAGVTPELLPAVFDAAGAKQGKFLPGSRIPVYSPDQILGWDPDYVLVLPWNISAEVSESLERVLRPSARFFVVNGGVVSL